MNESTLMYNSYNPYGDFNSDINNIIEQEKKVNDDRINEYNNKKKKILPLNDDRTIDFTYIFEEITYVLNNIFKIILETKEFNKLFTQDTWVGWGYIFIIIYLTYFISKL